MHLQLPLISGALAAICTLVLIFRIVRLNRLAYTDTLTKLPNRAALSLHLRRAIRSARRSTQHTAVIFFDLDNFKAINDNLGHAMGDQVLAAVGAQLKAGLRPGDKVARLGGDEFIVIAPNLAQPRDAHLVYSRLAEMLNRTHWIAGRTVDIEASAGIAVLGRTKTTPHQLLEQADQALYRAKAKSHGRIRIANLTLS